MSIQIHVSSQRLFSEFQLNLVLLVNYVLIHTDPVTHILHEVLSVSSEMAHQVRNW